LIVATSALGTGVDFPGIVFTLHVDIPYGMIDFAQESGRAGRAGEDVDSVVLVEEGKAERQLASGKAAVDESIMCEFVTTVGCRRRVIGLYLDNKETGCSDEASVANCDRCGEGTTAIERVHTKRATERQTVEETLDEVAGGCVFCFVDSTEEACIDWSHSPEDCEKAEGGKRKGLDDRFRGMIRFEEGTHSCFKCGFSQKLCGTGAGEQGKC
jgi:superfamily II DNA helicase RecQ